MKVKKKYFKDNQSYFNYINKHKEDINVIKVNPVTKKDVQSKVILSYSKKELVA